MVERLLLEDFRVFSDKTLDFQTQTFIEGGNGVGKSSVIEAIRLLSVGKSFRTSRLDEAIGFNQPFFRLSAKINKKTAELFYGLSLGEARQRRLTVEDKEVGWLDFLGTLPTVLFVPGDLELIFGSPAGRRKYLDSILWQVDKEYRYNQLELARILKERSQLLFLLKINRAGLDELHPWTTLLVKHTEAIRAKRLELVDFLNDWFSKNQPKLTAKLTYQYDSRSSEQVQSEEIRNAENLIGCHRDELEVVFRERSARRFASRGQARTLVAMLKIAESDYLNATITAPTILLDDIFSELDESNSQLLVSYLGSRYQCVATGTHLPESLKGWASIKLG